MQRFLTNCRKSPAVQGTAHKYEGTSRHGQPGACENAAPDRPGNAVNEDFGHAGATVFVESHEDSQRLWCAFVRRGSQAD